ncbi:MAG: methyl-accepting chemotaxis protein [Burkholderiales bacterium]|nr:methyl-accepting chemotaxis protein [Burkholderiales bacterium]
MRISHKLGGAFGALVVFVAVIGGLGYEALHTLDGAIGSVADQALPSVRYVSAIRAEAIDFRNRETQLLLAKGPDEITDTLEREAKNLDNLKQYEGKLSHYIAGGEGQALFDRYHAALDGYLAAHAELVKLVQAGQVDAALTNFRGPDRQAFRDFLPTVDKLVEYNTQVAEATAKRAHDDYASARIMFLSLAALVIVLSIVMSILIMRSITPRLEGLASSIRDIERDLDFTRRVAANGDDEIADTARAFNGLAGNMQTVLQGAALASAQLMEMVARLAESAREVSSGSQKQSDASSAMAAGIEQLSTSISHLANAAREAMTHSNIADRNAQEGSKVIGQTVREMHAIAEEIQQVAHTMQQLDTRSQEIGGIVQVIREVADQTNLLALNAAIEAARAGEQGRGFAVVADEVRKLAERTTGATKDIGDKISAIQTTSEQVNAAMDDAKKRVETGVSLASLVGETVSTIVDNARLVENEVQTISEALKEQDEAGHLIATNVEQIADMVESNSVAAGATTRLTVELEGIASGLKCDIARFKA